MQKLQIIGYVGQDAVVKDFNSNQVIEFSVAVTEKWKDKSGETQTKTSWYDCSKWGNNVTVANYIKKGTLVYVEGTPEAKSWINKEGGVMQKLAVNVLNLKLLSSQSDDGTTVTPEVVKQMKVTPDPVVGSQAIYKEDDLPF